VTVNPRTGLFGGWPERFNSGRPRPGGAGGRPMRLELADGAPALIRPGVERAGSNSASSKLGGAGVWCSCPGGATVSFSLSCRSLRGGRVAVSACDVCAHRPSPPAMGLEWFGAVTGAATASSQRALQSCGSLPSSHFGAGTQRDRASWNGSSKGLTPAAPSIAIPPGGPGWHRRLLAQVRPLAKPMCWWTSAHPRDRPARVTLGAVLGGRWPVANRPPICGPREQSAGVAATGRPAAGRANAPAK